MLNVAGHPPFYPSPSLNALEILGYVFGFGDNRSGFTFGTAVLSHISWATCVTSHSLG